MGFLMFSAGIEKAIGMKWIKKAGFIMLMVVMLLIVSSFLLTFVFAMDDSEKLVRSEFSWKGKFQYNPNTFCLNRRFILSPLIGVI